MLYRIVITHESGSPALKVSNSRKRRDAAEQLAEYMAYQHVKDHAGLDTAWGNKARLAVRAIDPRLGGTADLFHGYFLTITPSRS